MTPEDTFYYSFLSKLNIEEWLPVPGLNNHYYCSNLGRVKSFKTDKNGVILKASPNTEGYIKYRLSTETNVRSISAHCIVLRTFVGKRPGPKNCVYGCHNNGHRTDNRLFNLRWDTPSNNSLDTTKHGRRVFNRAPLGIPRRLNKEQVQDIRQSIAKGEPKLSIARRLNISRSMLYYADKRGYNDIPR